MPRPIPVQYLKNKLFKVFCINCMKIYYTYNPVALQIGSGSPLQYLLFLLLSELQTAATSFISRPLRRAISFDDGKAPLAVSNSNKAA